MLRFRTTQFVRRGLEDGAGGGLSTLPDVSQGYLRPDASEQVNPISAYSLQ